MVHRAVKCCCQKGFRALIAPKCIFRRVTLRTPLRKLTALPRPPARFWSRFAAHEKEEAYLFLATDTVTVRHMLRDRSPVGPVCNVR